jgi:hypothetical protein
MQVHRLQVKCCSKQGDFMKKMMFIPILLTLFTSLQGSDTGSSVYGAPSPTYAPKATGIGSPTITTPQTQINRGATPQIAPNLQDHRQQVLNNSSSQYANPNNEKFNSDARSNPGQAGQKSYIQGQDLQGTYYQGQNLQGTYNQNQYEKQLYQNQNLHEQYQRGQGSVNNNIPHQPH